MSNPLVKVIALCATEPSVPAGAERVQINLDDAAVAGAMLRLTHLPESPKAVVCAWMPAESVESWVAGLPADAAAYSVEERVVLPITPDRVDAEGRVEGFANIALLRGQDWIDIPLVYKSGRRALITMEKGVPGSQRSQLPAGHAYSVSAAPGVFSRA